MVPVVCTVGSRERSGRPSTLISRTSPGPTWYAAGLGRGGCLGSARHGLGAPEDSQEGRDIFIARPKRPPSTWRGSRRSRFEVVEVGPPALPPVARKALTRWSMPPQAGVQAEIRSSRGTPRRWGRSRSSDSRGRRRRICRAISGEGADTRVDVEAVVLEVRDRSRPVEQHGRDEERPNWRVRFRPVKPWKCWPPPPRSGCSGRGSPGSAREQRKQVSLVKPTSAEFARGLRLGRSSFSDLVVGVGRGRARVGVLVSDADGAQALCNGRRPRSPEVDPVLAGAELEEKRGVSRSPSGRPPRSVEAGEVEEVLAPGIHLRRSRTPLTNVSETFSRPRVPSGTSSVASTGCVVDRVTSKEPRARRMGL